MKSRMLGLLARLLTNILTSDPESLMRLSEAVRDKLNENQGMNPTHGDDFVTHSQLDEAFQGVPDQESIDNAVHGLKLEMSDEMSNLESRIEEASGY